MLWNRVIAVTRKFLFAAFVIASIATPSDAATVLGGITGNEATGSASNDVFGSVLGFFGGNLVSSGTQQIRYTLLGYEAGYTNTFSAGSAGGSTSLLFSGGGGYSLTAENSPAFFQVDGSVNFSFNANLPTGTAVKNGASLSSASNSPNFFISFFDPDGNLGALSGSSGVIALDDGGGGALADADYDDLVIKFEFVSAVPLHDSTFPMLAQGLLVFGWLILRRRRASPPQAA